MYILEFARIDELERRLDEQLLLCVDHKLPYHGSYEARLGFSRCWIFYRRHTLFRNRKAMLLPTEREESGTIEGETNLFSLAL